MRALILCAGLGTRLRPLTDLCPKPAVPVRGVPVIGYLLALLSRHGVRETMINLHHLPERMREAAERCAPEGMRLLFSPEGEPLGTGGGIRRVADFLRESEVSLVLAGDMLLDTDLSAAVARHREAGDRVTLLLCDDPEREPSFGSIGIDERGRIVRIGSRFRAEEPAKEMRSGVFVGVRILSSSIFDSLPEREAFEDLSDWFAPQLAAGADDMGAELLPRDECTWTPVGTIAEYLDANLTPPRVSPLSPERIQSLGNVRLDTDLILGAGARLGSDVRLRRVVVWENETVPSGFTAEDGVYAGGAFHHREGRS